MKRVLTLVMAAVMVCTLLCACNNDDAYYESLLADKIASQQKDNTPTKPSSEYTKPFKPTVAPRTYYTYELTPEYGVVVISVNHEEDSYVYQSKCEKCGKLGNELTGRINYTTPEKDLQPSPMSCSCGNFQKALIKVKATPKSE